MKNICSSLLKISEQVSHALHHKQPVVALQSTIISHGMPYPQNKQCALSIQRTVRENGAVPATIAIFDGKIHVGLEDSHIEKLASSGTSAAKVSRRDLPIILSQKRIGATTVSATMIGAQASGIKLFVTGGIGGVHRGYEHTMDVSADLQELGHTPITVVSAGVKSILDIGRTLEYLQTKGVPVITYGSKYFPAFFSSSSGILSPFSESEPENIAKIIDQHHKLQLKNGILVAVPNNKPQEGEFIESAIQKALKESEEKGIKGARITPFLLGRVNQLTQGRSLASNISLVHNNAKIGTKIAVQFSKLQKKPSFSFSTQKQRKIIVIGGSAVDYRMIPAAGRSFELYKSCIATSQKTLGGVGRNIAEVCAKLNTKTTFITVLGNDDDAKMIENSCLENKIELHSIFQKSAPTGRYFALLDNHNNEMMGISQMHINDHLTFNNVYEKYFKSAQCHPNDIVVIDGNFSEESLAKMAAFCAQKGYFTVYEAKGQKSRRILNSQAYKWVNVIKMNRLQKKQVIDGLKTQLKPNDWLSSQVSLENHNKQYTNIRSIVTDGPNPIEIIRNNKIQELKVEQSKNVIKTTGAGDTLTGVFCSLLLKGQSDSQALKYGVLGSQINIEGKVQIGGSIIANDLNMEQLKSLYSQKY